jgi:Integrase core domain
VQRRLTGPCVSQGARSARRSCAAVFHCTLGGIVTTQVGGHISGEVTVLLGNIVPEAMRHLFPGQNCTPVNKLDFTHSGKSTENGHIESLNGRLRDECLNVQQFVSLEHARATLNSWRDDYNHTRPHGSLGHLTPSEFANRGQKTDPKASKL